MKHNDNYQSSDTSDSFNFDDLTYKSFDDEEHDDLDFEFEDDWDEQDAVEEEDSETETDRIYSALDALSASDDFDEAYTEETQEASAKSETAENEEVVSDTDKESDNEESDGQPPLDEKTVDSPISLIQKTKATKTTEKKGRQKRTKQKSKKQKPVNQNPANQKSASKKGKLNFRQTFYFMFLFLYLETIVHVAVFKSIGITYLYIIAFSFIFACVLSSLFSLFSRKINYRLTMAITILSILFYGTEIVYHSVFQKFLALFTMMGVAGQAFDFMSVIFKNIWSNIIGILLLLLPVFVLKTLKKKRILAFRKKSYKHSIRILATGLCTYGVTIITLIFSSHAPYSPYDIYYHNVSEDMTAEHFGVLNMNRLDAIYTIFGKPEKSLDAAALSETDKKPSDGSPNTMDIDFETIIANAPNDKVKQLSEYFQAQPGTTKNEYTGMFEGYNVIFICAEGFSKYAIDEKLTPTLYRLANEGFQFEHFYTPGWYASTSDGEYTNLTGLIPSNGEVSMKATGERSNNMYFTLGRQLEREGYTLNGFHNNDYQYYGRDKSHPNMGYEWFGIGNWFSPETNQSGNNIWPQSDYELFRQSVDLYMDKEPFHTYYMTVSGHATYTFTSNNMSYRNKEAVENLEYSETTQGYLASQIELEKGLKLLVDELEERDLADRTLIVLNADHIPYNDKPVCDELAGHELEENIEWYENQMILWSGSMEEPIKVDKYCSTLDILPTLSNLLGLEYDSRLMIGQDILSDSTPLVYFSDRSFITDKCMYNATTKECTPLTEEEVTQDYLDTISSAVYTKFSVAKMILEEDYYQYLEGNIKASQEDSAQEETEEETKEDTKKTE